MAIRWAGTLRLPCKYSLTLTSITPPLASATSANTTIVARSGRVESPRNENQATEIWRTMTWPCADTGGARHHLRNTTALQRVSAVSATRRGWKRSRVDASGMGEVSGSADTLQWLRSPRGGKQLVIMKARGENGQRASYEERAISDGIDVAGWRYGAIEDTHADSAVVSVSERVVELALCWRMHLSGTAKRGEDDPAAASALHGRWL
ncbi:hypothetical protein B0H13DRAFT_2518183, partial [Mycena leptocephala]